MFYGNNAVSCYSRYVALLASKNRYLTSRQIATDRTPLLVQNYSNNHFWALDEFSLHVRKPVKYIPVLHDIFEKDNINIRNLLVGFRDSCPECYLLMKLVSL